MDVIVVQPYLNQCGGSERVILEIAKKFNPIIYVVDYDKEKTYVGFSEFEIRKISPHILEYPVGMAASFDQYSYVGQVATSGVRFLNMKVADDYDVLSAHLTPSDWIRNRNENVCWYCHGLSAAFSLETAMRGRTPAQRLMLRAGALPYRVIELAILKKMEKICTCSYYSKRRISEYLGRGDAEVARPGVDAKDFECRDYERFFLCVSRISPEKQMEFAIEAFKKFNRQRKWKLVIAGWLHGNPQNTDYLNYLKELSRSQNIFFEINPPQGKIRRLYSNCYATLLSSPNEPWGIVPLESMASSKPCISTNKGGPRESVIDGKTGFLVGTTDEMAEKMRFLADHLEINEKMGKAGRKRVEEKYTWKIFLGKMEKAFREAAQG